MSCLRFPGGPLAISIITILVIAGTLSSCGRYGSPERLAPGTDTTEGWVGEVAEQDASLDEEIDDESSDRSDWPDLSEE